MTPLMPTEGAVDVDQPTIDDAEEGVDAFRGSSCVTRTGSIVCTFLVNEEMVPMNIERITGHYRLFDLVFIVCV